MATIRKRLNGDGTTSYEVQVRLRGAPAETKTFERIGAAKRWAVARENEIRERRVFGLQAQHERTVSEMVKRYVESHLPQLKSEHDQDQRTTQLAWWCQHIGSYTLAQVTPGVISELRDLLAKGGGPTGRPMKSARQNRYLAALSRVFSVARREWQWCQANPLQSVERRAEGRGRIRMLSDAERDALLVACRKSPHKKLLVLVLAALSTGARVGELMKLTWADVDLDRGVARLLDTKNGEERTVPLAGEARSLLLALRPPKGKGGEELPVFGSTFPRKAWASAVADAGLANFRFHDLRHTFASWTAMSGATLAELASLLGHKSLAMVKRYTHFTEQHHAGLVERMVRSKLASGAEPDAPSATD